jgi:HAUS augmin-like complex subunit 1
MAQLSPSAMFSPSAARQELAAAKDWNYIDGWLNTKFNGRSAPPFERNKDTLKALLALAALNEGADEDCELLAKVEAKSLQELQAKETTDPNGELLEALEDNLTREGHVSLDAIASAGVLLNQPLSNVQQLAGKIIELQVACFNLYQASDRVDILHKHLSTELEQINALVEELRDDKYRQSSELLKLTVDYQRKSKVLAAKLSELKSRVIPLRTGAGNPNITIQDVKVEEEKFAASMATVKELETQVKSYYGLPHDTDLARLELESVRAELKHLTKQRDGMFEGLVERESPQKFRK